MACALLLLTLADQTRTSEAPLLLHRRSCVRAPVRSCVAVEASCKRACTLSLPRIRPRPVHGQTAQYVLRPAPHTLRNQPISCGRRLQAARKPAPVWSIYSTLALTSPEIRPSGEARPLGP